MILKAAISHQKHHDVDKNHRKAVRVANLRNVADRAEGILRIKKGKSFYYTYKNKPYTNEKELSRIKKLAIPPSWTNSCWHSLRKKVNRDAVKKEMSAEKVLAAAIHLMEQTHIRVGNNGYEKLYGSYVLTTFKDRHEMIKKDEGKFSFTGKNDID